MIIVDNTVAANVQAMRLDKYLSNLLQPTTRAQIKLRCINASVNGKKVKLAYEIKAGDVLRIELKDEDTLAVNNAEGKAVSILPENIDLSIIYEDNDVIVVDKPQGLVVHPAHGNWTGTLANALMGRFALSSEGLQRAGIVHRLDKDTSGVIISAKNVIAQEYLASQFRARTVKKTYIAVVKGRPKTESGCIENYLSRDPNNRKKFKISNNGSGKKAISTWKLLDFNNGFSLLALYPHTGRTHQLRVHCKAMHCPIAGDPIYGSSASNSPQKTHGLMLHAYKLSISIPNNSEPSIFCAPIPERFYQLCSMAGLDIRRL